MEERRKYKNNEQIYHEKSKLVKRKCNEAKEEWLKAQCTEFENNIMRDSKYMHSKIKEITRKASSTNTGNRVFEIKRWLNLDG